MNLTLFWILASVIVLASCLAVTVGNLLRAAVALMLSFLTTAALFIVMRSEFIAVAHILVYVGGIIIFIIFAVLLTSHLGEVHPRYPLKLRALALLLSACVLCSFVWFFFTPGVRALVTAEAIHIPVNMPDLGLRLLSNQPNGWLLPFELISVLLLAAMVGAIVIARKDRRSE